jgi:ribosomal protein S18 acetylase RimI-like enzyme
VVCDKLSVDGSAKLNIRPDPNDAVDGAVYEIDDDERSALDASEPGYTPTMVDVDGSPTLIYIHEGKPHVGAAYDWYVAMARLGAASHGLAEDRFAVEASPDPLVSGLRPATLDDLHFIQSILSAGLSAETDRYYIHPGDFAWWTYHDDPRFPDHDSTWIQDDSGFVTIDALSPSEINVFTLPGVDRMPLIRWSQRRLGDAGEVGWVADDDAELVDALHADGYEPAHTNRSYSWDLTGDLPEPAIPTGWRFRALAGESEANPRRAASHAAFESDMPSAVHLQRYIDFMRSPAYVPERDLVAVDPSGRIVAFMVWWADESGVAQIEPFGTHPDFQRQGVGRALIHHGLAEMKAAGIHTCRVITDEQREATAFYEGVGFSDVGRVRWWRKA